MTRLLVAAAVEAEAQAIRGGLPPGEAIQVHTVGVGSARAAANTARLLALAEAAGRPYAGVLSAGIAGGFADRAPVGATVIAIRSVAADLGTESADGFRSIDELGFGSAVAIADGAMLDMLRGTLRDAVAGDVLTVNTVTGTAAGAEALAGRHPSAVAEAMEGYGVACAAATVALPFAELRTVSNAIGPRDRSAWRIGDALAALGAAAPALHRLAAALG